MNQLAVLLTKRVTFVVSKRALSSLSRTSVLALGSQSGRTTQRFLTPEKVPEEDYYDGHLLTEHLEYLDDMLDKTLKIETSMEELKQTYAQKRKAYETQDSGSNEEIYGLFEKSASQKKQLSHQIADLKAVLMQAQGTFAVDAPDGTSDAQLRDGLKEVNQIIDYAAEHEDVNKINKLHGLQDAVKKERARDPEHDW
jgi:hypothetical protein